MDKIKAFYYQHQGACIAVLAIVVVVVGYYFYKSNQKEDPDKAGPYYLPKNGIIIRD